MWYKLFLKNQLAGRLAKLIEEQLKFCVIYLNNKYKHSRPLSSYAKDIPLLGRIGVNVGAAYHSHEAGS